MCINFEIYIPWQKLVCFYDNQSDGIEETHLLAEHYCKNAKHSLRTLRDSNEKSALIDITEAILHRSK